MICFGEVPDGAMIVVPFATYGKTNGESITMTGLAVTDIEVYRANSMTQRASDNGYALLDTDGIDIDGITGIHGFSVDLSDNSDASFYAAGYFYYVVVSAITVDSQTVNFIAATWRIVATEDVTGMRSVNLTKIEGQALVTHTSGTVPADMIALSVDQTAANNAESFFDGTGYAGTNNVIPTVTDVTNRVTANSDQFNGSAISAARLAQMFAVVRRITVDDSTFTPTTTEFETDQTVDDQERYTEQVLWGEVGDNAGVTIPVTAYAFTNSKVKLTVETMAAAPANGDTFLIMGRIESTD